MPQATDGERSSSSAGKQSSFQRGIPAALILLSRRYRTIVEKNRYHSLNAFMAMSFIKEMLMSKTGDNLWKDYMQYLHNRSSIGDETEVDVKMQHCPHCDITIYIAVEITAVSNCAFCHGVLLISNGEIS
jgi:hypothetical protein